MICSLIHTIVSSLRVTDLLTFGVLPKFVIIVLRVQAYRERILPKEAE
jgi:hypothetical protein